MTQKIAPHISINFLVQARLHLRHQLQTHLLPLCAPISPLSLYLSTLFRALQDNWASLQSRTIILEPLFPWTTQSKYPAHSPWHHHFALTPPPPAARYHGSFPPSLVALLALRLLPGQLLPTTRPPRLPLLHRRRSMSKKRSPSALRHQSRPLRPQNPRLLLLPMEMARNRSRKILQLLLPMVNA